MKLSSHTTIFCKPSHELCTESDVQNNGEHSSELHNQVEGKGKGKALERIRESKDGKGEYSVEAAIPTYRILNKVRSLWQLMDLPSQKYIFR